MDRKLLNGIMHFSIYTLNAGSVMGQEIKAKLMNDIMHIFNRLPACSSCIWLIAASVEHRKSLPLYISTSKCHHIMYLVTENTYRSLLSYCDDLLVSCAWCYYGHGCLVILWTLKLHKRLHHLTLQTTHVGAPCSLHHDPTLRCYIVRAAARLWLVISLFHETLFLIYVDNIDLSFVLYLGHFGRLKAILSVIPPSFGRVE